MMRRGLNVHRRTWFQRVRTVFHKEVVDHARDKRSIVLALIYPLLGPILLAVLLHVGAGSLGADQVRRSANTGPLLSIGATGMEHAPDLAEFFERSNIAVSPTASDPVDLVQSGDWPVVVVVPPEAATDQHYTIDIVTDPGHLDQSQAAATIRGAVEAYGRWVGLERLRAAGFDTSDLNPVSVRETNVGRPPNLANFFYNMMPPLIVFMVFLGAVYLAIDTTAGERERGSLEPLLMTPTERWELLLGKTLAAFLFTAVTVAINLSSFRILLGIVVASHDSLAAPPSVGTIGMLFIVALPLMALAVSLQVAIAMMTRSMKEAQIYLGLLPVVPALPAMALAFVSVNPGFSLGATPVISQLIQFSRLAAGDTIDPIHVVSASVTTIALAYFVFRFAVRLFRRERQFFHG